MIFIIGLNFMLMFNNNNNKNKTYILNVVIKKNYSNKKRIYKQKIII
jgi:hypothetical protein